MFARIRKPGTHKSRSADVDYINMRAVKKVGNNTESIEDDAPLPSFSTVDEHSFPEGDDPFKEADHGEACCVYFSVEELNVDGTKVDNREALLVGTAHTKVQWRPWYSKKKIPQEKKDRLIGTHYVSYTYAFDSHLPFGIRARSGYFCLGHTPSSLPGVGNGLPPTEGGMFNLHPILTRNRMLRQNIIAFDCP